MATRTMQGAAKGGDSERLYLQAARELEQRIRQGEYPVGRRLPPERELAEEYRISRATVREAVIALEMRGLVQTRQGAGIFVVADKPRAPGGGRAPAAEADTGPFEATEARRLIEGEIAALAAAVASAEALDALERLTAEMENADRDIAAREQADRGFHVALARATGNDALAGIVAQLWDTRHSSPLCSYFFDRARALKPEPPAEEHRAILAALRARDAVAAREAMRRHLANVTEALFLATEHDARDRARLDVEQRRHAFARRARRIGE